MKKTIEVITPEKREFVIEQYCDVCLIKTVPHRRGNCKICSRHVCENCLEWEDAEGDYNGDYPDSYCKSCHKARFKDYYLDYEKLSEKHWKEKNDLDEEVKRYCINIINHQSSGGIIN
jgi:hypothetical protein